jgi:hypothetical protein
MLNCTDLACVLHHHHFYAHLHHLKHHLDDHHHEYHQEHHDPGESFKISSMVIKQKYINLELYYNQCHLDLVKF